MTTTTPRGTGSRGWRWRQTDKPTEGEMMDVGVNVPRWVLNRYLNTVAEDWTARDEAWVHKSATIGPAVTIGPHATIGPRVIIGQSTNIGRYAIIAESAVICPFATIGPNIIIGEFATIGEFAIIGPHVSIGPHAIIAESAIIGPHAIIEPDATIEPDSIGSIPRVMDLESRIFGAIESGGTLNMDSWHGSWHTCETMHCRAGWAIHLAGESGKELERKTSPWIAGALIYRESCGYVPDFYATSEAALTDIRERAAKASVATLTDGVLKVAFN